MRYIVLQHARVDHIFDTPAVPMPLSADVAAVIDVGAAVEAVATAAINIVATGGNTAAVARCSMVVTAAAAEKAAVAAARNRVVAYSTHVTVDSLCHLAYHDLHGDRPCYDLRCRIAL